MEINRLDCLEGAQRRIRTFPTRGFSLRNENSFFLTVNGRGRTSIQKVAISDTISRKVSLLPDDLHGRQSKRVKVYTNHGVVDTIGWITTHV